ncbi:MAG: NADH-quinone oxidoreductase subunit N [Acidimicrobiales bacterium]|nr:NADH-quinone oxidoreductase subunit N [Acidimicrobiales bacterium]
MLAFVAPSIDYHAFAPELIVVAILAILVLVDCFTSDYDKSSQSSVAGFGLLLALIPVVTLAMDGTVRGMFGSPESGYAYVVDTYSLILKALFLVSGYVVVLLSQTYIAEGDYWEGEYYQLLLASILGMMVMASARDLVSIFVALELLSIPAYMLAAWRKRDLKSDEAGIKYYLMGVFASAVMLYGMSLIYGITGSTLLTEVAANLRQFPAGQVPPIVVLAVVFVLVGFGFKVSAVPFHTWAPDTYEGAPTPVTAFLAVASKAAGFVALMTLVFVAFPGNTSTIEPLMFALSAATMTVGNLIALRQTNIVRLLAYSGVAQAGYMLAPLAVYGVSGTVGLQAIIAYLLIYAAMNLGAFAVVITAARKTRSGEISSFGGLIQYAPSLAVLMCLFLFSLAGIPPLGGWFAKFAVFRALVGAETGWGYALAVLVGINSVIALFYYARVAKTMVMDPAPDGDLSPVRVPFSLRAALVITAMVTVAVGVLPGLVGHFTDSVTIGAALGS